jgi:hypothetical protein
VRSVGVHVLINSARLSAGCTPQAGKCLPLPHRLAWMAHRLVSSNRPTR